MNAWKRFFLFLALAVLQLHAAIPHHHHHFGDHQVAFHDCSDAENDLSHPDLGDNHLEDLTEAQAKRLWVPIFACVPHFYLMVKAPSNHYVAAQEHPNPCAFFNKHLRRGPPNI